MSTRSPPENPATTHRESEALGPGRVVAVEGRTALVEFPRTAVSLRLAASLDPARQPVALAALVIGS